MPKLCAPSLLAGGSAAARLHFPGARCPRVTHRGPCSSPEEFGLLRLGALAL